MVTVTTSAPAAVLPTTDARSWDYGDGRVGLTWATPPLDGGEWLSTSVIVRTDAAALTHITREGKGDRLRVHLTDAARHMTPVVFTDHRVVAYLSTAPGGATLVQTPEQYDAAVRGDDTDYAEYANVETALVDLAFWHVS